MTTAGVHVHRAERADVLADALAEVLARPPADPFAAEVVAVPAKGVERWLAQRLSHRLGAPDGDGICAGVAFRSPAALVAESISGAVGGAPDADPWHPERAVWPLLEVLDAAADEPLCAVWSDRAVPVLRARFQAGERAMHRAIDGLDIAWVTVAPADLHNINTPGDLGNL